MLRTLDINSGEVLSTRVNYTLPANTNIRYTLKITAEDGTASTESPYTWLNLGNVGYQDIYRDDFAGKPAARRLLLHSRGPGTSDTILLTDIASATAWRSMFVPETVRRRLAAAALPPDVEYALVIIRDGVAVVYGVRAAQATTLAEQADALARRMETTPGVTIERHTVEAVFGCAVL